MGVYRKVYAIYGFPVKIPVDQYSWDYLEDLNYEGQETFVDFSVDTPDPNVDIGFVALKHISFDEYENAYKLAPKEDEDQYVQFFLRNPDIEILEPPGIYVISEVS